MSKLTSQKSVCERGDSPTLTGRAGALIQELKAQMLSGSVYYSGYFPYEHERQLTEAIETGAVDEANRLLNELLGHIFLLSSYNLDALKVRAMELIVLISRAASRIDTSSPVPPLESERIRAFFELTSFDEVCVSLSELLRAYISVNDRLYPADSSQIKHTDVITGAVGYIKANFMRKLSLAEVAEAVYVSPSYLSRMFSEELNISFSEYLNSVRIDRSRILLRDRNLSIMEIAGIVGFSDQSYYSKIFRQRTGTTPKKYRDK